MATSRGLLATWAIVLGVLAGDVGHLVHHRHLIGQRRRLTKNRVEARDHLPEVHRHCGLTTAARADVVENGVLTVGRVVWTWFVLGLEIETCEHQSRQVRIPLKIARPVH